MAVAVPMTMAWPPMEGRERNRLSSAPMPSPSMKRRIQMRQVMVFCTHAALCRLNKYPTATPANIDETISIMFKCYSLMSGVDEAVFLENVLFAYEVLQCGVNYFRPLPY